VIGTCILNSSDRGHHVAFLRISRAKDAADAVGGIEHTIAAQSRELIRRGWKVTVLLAGCLPTRTRLSQFFTGHTLTSVELHGESPLEIAAQVRAAALERGIGIVVAENHREVIAAAIGIRRDPSAVLVWRHHTLPKPRGFRCLLTPFVDRLLLNRVAGHLVISRSLAGELPKFRRVRAPIYVVPNGIAPPDGRADCVTASNDPLPRRIAMIARLDGNKGHDVLLTALSILKDFRISANIIGDGCCRNAIAKLAVRLNVADQVTFLGQLSDPWEPLQDTEVIVLPSANEGSPLVLLEAFARKKLVVASAVGAVGELVEDNQTGFLIPPGTPQALADSLVNIFERPSSGFLRHRMRAYDCYRQRHTIEHSSAKLESAILAAYGLH
jgi:glycosyltransferase involved in cell wall biosynthesis